MKSTKHRGRPPLPPEQRRVQFPTCTVAPSTRDIIKASGLPIGRTLDHWAKLLTKKNLL